MNEYYFLFAMAFVFTFFASIQDLKKREVANWLNFSLIIFGLAYRAFYSIILKDFRFFFLGVLGLVIFIVMAHILYYGKAFAGGDAKLLMGLGIILPYTDLKSFIYLPLIFIFILFLIGAVYSIIYSFLIIRKNKARFIKEFKFYLMKYKFISIVSVILFVITLTLIKDNPAIISLAFLLLIPILFIYTKSLEKTMIKNYNYNELTEGDWLVSDIKLTKNIIIKKSVHGLSLEDIKLIKKYKRNVFIKEGIPFIPAFLITLLSLGIVYFFNLYNFIINIF